MNWPPLDPKCSAAVADVLKDVVHSKPKDLFEYVAQALQDRSGLDPEEFERFFEECKRKPRTYVLEDRCPAGQDPFSWVPMRFNDDTILLTLQQRASDLSSEIISALPIEDTKGFLDRACIAYPELLYLRAQPSEPVTSQGSFVEGELAAYQALRVVYLGCSGCSTCALDDESPALSFLSEALVRDAREQVSSFSQGAPMVEALIIFGVFRVLGSHEGFQRRFGGGLTDPTAAILHALDREAAALPSFQRLPEGQRQLVRAALEVYFPLQLLISQEAVPAHFQKLKDLMGPIEGGIGFYLCAVILDHMVYQRTSVVAQEAVDLARLCCKCLANAEKYTASRAYDILLRKRAERQTGAPPGTTRP